jgi:hypothetical protein
MPTKMMRMVEADLVTAVVIRLTLAGRVGIGREVDGAGVAARQVSDLCQQKNAFFSFQLLNTQINLSILNQLIKRLL